MLLKYPETELAPDFWLADAFDDFHRRIAQHKRACAVHTRVKPQLVLELTADLVASSEPRRYAISGPSILRAPCLRLPASFGAQNSPYRERELFPAGMFRLQTTAAARVSAYTRARRLFSEGAFSDSRSPRSSRRWSAG
jgi:hypothetical protein